MQRFIGWTCACYGVHGVNSNIVMFGELWAVVLLRSLLLLKDVRDALHYVVGLHVLGSEAVVCNTCIALTLAYFNKDVGINFKRSNNMPCNYSS